MTPEWTAEVIALMHRYKIKSGELAKKMGVRREYLSMILNGKRTPKDAEAKIRNAISEMIKED